MPFGGGVDDAAQKPEILIQRTVLDAEQADHRHDGGAVVQVVPDLLSVSS